MSGKKKGVVLKTSVSVGKEIIEHERKTMKARYGSEITVKTGKRAVRFDNERVWVYMLVARYKPVEEAAEQ